MAEYYTTLTTIGEAKLANAFALSMPLPIVAMAVGDGGGSVPVPDKAQTQLANEVRRAALNRIGPDEINPTALLAEQVIPAEVGGWWIRELGLYDKDGDLIAVGNCPPTYKPLLTEGSGRTQILRMLIAVSSTEAVELKIDPSAVLATREWVENKLKSGAVSVSIDGPSPVFAGSVNTYKITNYHSLSEYQVSTDLGEASITGDTITLLLADTDTQSPATLRIIRDGILNMFEIEVIEKSIAQPQILTPVNAATDVFPPVILTSTPYSSYPDGIGTHSKSHWKLTSDYAGLNILWESFDDTVNLTYLELSNSYLDNESTYYVHLRYYSAALGYSEWSQPSKFTTAVVLFGIGVVLPDGGIMFAQDGGDWLVAAPATMRSVRKFGLYNTNTSLPDINYTNPVDPNTGEYNTDILTSPSYASITEADGITGCPAADYARSVSDGSYSLPNVNEMRLIYENKALIDSYDQSGGSAKLSEITGYVYSSTEAIFTTAPRSIVFNFNDGTSTTASRNSNYLSIPYKRIPV